jgi:hypothetical protein
MEEMTVETAMEEMTVETAAMEEMTAETAAMEEMTVEMAAMEEMTVETAEMTAATDFWTACEALTLIPTNPNVHLLYCTCIFFPVNLVQQFK